MGHIPLSRKKVNGLKALLNKTDNEPKVQFTAITGKVSMIPRVDAEWAVSEGLGKITG